MPTQVKPRDSDELRAFVAWAAAEQQPLELVGAGSKRGWGRPVQASYGVHLSGLTGVTLYEPDELVLSARAGTRLAAIEALLAEHRQQLAFEPADFGPLYGGPAGQATIGGILACNLSGPRRISAGAARDHFLGARAVNGRGELFKTGGRVVKNVTGYDLCKLLAGSHGTLAALVEVTLKVLPAPERTRSLLMLGLDDRRAVDALTAALKSEHGVSGAAHLPEPISKRCSLPRVAGSGRSVTALRLEGFPASVSQRAAALAALMAPLGAVEALEDADSRQFWSELRDGVPFAARPQLAVWRASAPPAAGPEVVARIAARGAVEAYYDWGGGLIWLGLPAEGDAGAAAVHAACAAAGGHATLLRAPEAVRASVSVFEPPSDGLARLSARIKESFDPHGIFNPGRLRTGL